MTSRFVKIKESLPEGFGRFLIFLFIIYSFFVVGKVIYDNFKQNEIINQKRQEIVDLKNQVEESRLNIIYFKTDTYREKIARSKLRYAAPGETVVAVAYDPDSKKSKKADLSPVIINRPNYIYWRIYFFGR